MIFVVRQQIFYISNLNANILSDVTEVGNFNIDIKRNLRTRQVSLSIVYGQS